MSRLFHILGLPGTSIILTAVLSAIGLPWYVALLPLFCTLVVASSPILVAIVRDCRDFGNDFHRESRSWKLRSMLGIIVYPAFRTLPILLGNRITTALQRDMLYQLVAPLIPTLARIMILAYLFKHF